MALGAIGPDAVPAVVKKLNYKKDSSVAILAASTLATMKPAPQQAVAPLKRLLNNKDLYVRKAAAEAIEAITGTGPYDR